MKKLSYRIAATLLVVAMVPGMSAAQQTNRSRVELEMRLRELEAEMRAIQTRLRQDQPDRTLNLIPRVMELMGNRARMGVTVQSGANEETDAMGAVLESVVPNGPAAKAGLRAGDIITKFDGEPLPGRYPAARRGESEPATKLVDLVQELEEGTEVEIEYRRDGRMFTTMVTLAIVEGDTYSFFGSGPDIRVGSSVSGRLELSQSPSNVLLYFSSGMWSQMELVALNDDLGRYFGTSEGLLVINAPGGENIDLRSGDVILNIDGREAATPARAMRILSSYERGESIEMEIMRDRSRQTITVKLPERETRENMFLPRTRGF